MQRKEEIFQMAEEMGIEIAHAKSKQDANKTAIHLLNPVMDQLEDALFEAERKSFTMVVIHSRQTWPVSAEKEKLEVGHNDRLLA